MLILVHFGRGFLGEIMRFGILSQLLTSSLYLVVWLDSVLFILAITLGNYLLTKVLLFLYLFTSCTLFVSDSVEAVKYELYLYITL